MALSSSVPILVALDAVAAAVNEAIDADVFEGRPVRVVKTLRPMKALEELGADLLLIVHPTEVNSEPTTSVFDEYTVSIATELLTKSNSTEEDPHQQERDFLTVGQTIADEIRRRCSIKDDFFQRADSGSFAADVLEELDVMSSAFNHSFRIQHDVSGT